MPIEVIGREILPNLYIKNIQLSPTNVKVTVACFDYLDQEGKITWLTSDFVNLSNVKINLIMAKNNVLENVFNSGDYNLYQEKQLLPASINFNVESLDKVIQFVNLSELRPTIANSLATAPLESYIEINHTFGFSLDENIEISNLTCYAFFSYDIYEEDGHGYLDPTSENKKMLNGPIMSENIISNGSIVTTTRRFKIDTVGYPGPLHVHEGQAMEGSFHTEVPHRNVESDVVPNTKISFTNLVSQFSGKPLVNIETEKYFTTPYLAVANKQIYGFFKFKTEDYFKSKQHYRYFVDSSISLNLFKIKKHIKMYINSEQVEIREVLINHDNSNDMWFYFEVDFASYIETDLDIVFEVANINNIFKQVYENLKTQFEGFLAPFQKAAFFNTEYLPIVVSREILDFINGYVGLISMFYDIDGTTLLELKKLAVSSLYKSRVKRLVLVEYINEYQHALGILNTNLASITNTSSSIYSEEVETTVKLQNYKSALFFLGATKLVDPDKIADHLELTISNITNFSGLFQNAQQILLPRYIRNSFGNLEDINYSDLPESEPDLKVLQPEDIEEEEEIDLAFGETMEPESDPAQNSQEISDPDIEQPPKFQI